MDYFESPAQRKLEKIFNWDDSFQLKPGRPLIKLLRMIGREIALQVRTPSRSGGVARTDEENGDGENGDGGREWRCRENERMAVQREWRCVQTVTNARGDLRR